MYFVTESCTRDLFQGIEASLYLLTLPALAPIGRNPMCTFPTHLLSSFLGVTLLILYM